MLLLLMFAFLAGIFTVLSPCILPILPILLSVGAAEGRLRPLGMILGLIVSFTFFTLSLTALVHATGVSANVLRYVAIALIFLFGLIMIFPNLSNWFARVTTIFTSFGQRLQMSQKGSGFWGGFLFGIALGLLWTPCAGPILAAITTLVATQAITLSAISITLAYSIGAGIPMFLIAYGGNRIVQSSKFLSAHTERLRQIFGGLMIVTALAIALHWDMILQQKITSFVPPVIIENNQVVKTQLEQLRKENISEMRDFIPDQFGNYGKAPELTGIVNWINSPPLSLNQLKGKVVLVDFWTYSCINCIRTLPYLEQWYQDYKGDGFTIIGVHTPEFEFEKDPKNVAAAASRLGVKYPIAQDNDYKTWNAYHNRYWPAHYLIDQYGNVRLVHYGEGAYGETENAIRQLLGMAPIKMKEAVTSQKPITPETYLGTDRGMSYTSENAIKPGLIAMYAYEHPLSDDHVGLRGKWEVAEDHITPESDASYLDLNFQASQVYLVLTGSSRTPLEVTLDGQRIRDMIIDGDREYPIVNIPYGRHLVSLKVPKGVKAYVFTFGNEQKY